MQVAYADNLEQFAIAFSRPAFYIHSLVLQFIHTEVRNSLVCCQHCDSILHLSPIKVYATLNIA